MARRRKRYLDNAAPADNTANVVRPIVVQREENIKARSPKRQDYEKAKEERRVQEYRRQRQGTIGPYREKNHIDKAGGRLYAAAEQRAKEAQAVEEASVAVNALLRPIMPSTYVDMYKAYQNGQVHNLTDALASPYLTGNWSQQNPGKALAADIIAPAVIGKAGIIGRNIANRNLFSYAYLEPYGYENAVSRGKTILSHIVGDNTLPSVNRAITGNPLYRGIRNVTGGYRDEAFRKFLGLPEQTPLYVPNGDGTFGYNLRYLSRGGKHVALPEPGKGGVAGDLFTGNGGNISIQFDDVNKIAHIYDPWDINPFSRMKTPDIGAPVRTLADNVYKGLFPLYDGAKPWGRFGYNYLGGKHLNRLRYSNTPEKVTKFVNKLIQPIRKLDAANLLGGKTFVLRQDIPYTEMPYDDFLDMPIDAINLGEFAQGLSRGKIVDFNRVGTNGLIIR